MGYVEEIDLTGFDEEVVEQKSLLKDTVGKREEEEREESYLNKDEEKGDDMEKEEDMKEKEEKEEKEEESFTSERDSRPLNCFMTLESVMPCDTTVLS